MMPYLFLVLAMILWWLHLRVRNVEPLRRRRSRR